MKLLNVSLVSFGHLTLFIPLYDFSITRYLAGLIFKNTALGLREALKNEEHELIQLNRIVVF